MRWRQIQSLGAGIRNTNGLLIKVLVTMETTSWHHQKKKEKFFALMERAFSTICPSFPSSLYPPQKEKCWMRLWSSAFHLSRFLTSCFNHSPAMLENPHLICKDVLLFSTAIWISSALWSVSFLTLSYNILMCFTN